MSTLIEEYAEELTAIDDLEADRRYRILADERRRAVLDIVESSEAAVSVRDLAAAVADRTGAPRESVVIDLHHVHLPMLADFDVLEYDSEAGRVELFDHSPDESA